MGRNRHDLHDDYWNHAGCPGAAQGLLQVRFHDLRHSAATLLLAQGVHPRVVMDLLGHSSISVTLDTYSHVIPDMQRESASQMDAVLNPVASTVASTTPEGHALRRPN